MSGSQPDGGHHDNKYFNNGVHDERKSEIEPPTTKVEPATSDNCDPHGPENAFDGRQGSPDYRHRHKIAILEWTAGSSSLLQSSYQRSSISLNTLPEELLRIIFKFSSSLDDARALAFCSKSFYDIYKDDEGGIRLALLPTHPILSDSGRNYYECAVRVFVRKQITEVEDQGEVDDKKRNKILRAGGFATVNAIIDMATIVNHTADILYGELMEIANLRCDHLHFAIFKCFARGIWVRCLWDIWILLAEGEKLVEELFPIGHPGRQRHRINSFITEHICLFVSRDRGWRNSGFPDTKALLIVAPADWNMWSCHLATYYRLMDFCDLEYRKARFNSLAKLFRILEYDANRKLIAKLQGRVSMLESVHNIFMTRLKISPAENTVFNASIKSLKDMIAKLEDRNRGAEK